MPVTVRWDDPAKTILCYTYTGQWTWEQYDEAVTQALELTKEGGAIDVIADFSQSSLLPDRALSHFRNSLNQKNRSIPFEMTVLIIKSDFMARMLEIFGQLYGRGGVGAKLKSAHSIEEARQIIADRRARLKSMP